MILEKANIIDSEILSTITKRSKAYWGYSDEQIESWSDVLTITPSYIETRNVHKLTVDNKIVGYYSFFYKDEHAVILDNLFVLPEYIGKGFGGVLINDFLSHIRQSGVNKVSLESDPNAEDFYLKHGFIKAGKTETAIPGRYLSVMELRINDE